MLAVYDESVAPLIDPLLLYHKYDNVIPPETATVKLSVPPVQIVPATGCVVIDGSALTVTATVLLVTDEHPLPVEDTIQ